MLFRSLVGQPEEGDVESVGHRRVERLEDEIRIGDLERRVDVGGTAASHRLPGGHDDLHRRMTGDEAQQLRSGVPRGTDDPDP